MSRLVRSPPSHDMQKTLSDSDVANLAPNFSTPSFVSQRNKRQRESSEEQLSSFKEEIKTMFKEFQNSLINKISSEMTEIKQQNTDLKRDVKKSMDFMNKQYEEMRQKVLRNRT